MTKRIFYSILGACLFVLIVVCSVTVQAVYNGLVSEQIASLESETKLMARALNHETNKVESLKEFASSTVRVSLVEPDGDVVFDSLNEDGVHEENENNNSHEEIIQARETGSGFSIRRSKSQSEEIYYYAVRLDDGNIIRISRSHSTLLNLFYQTILPMIFIVGFLVLFCAVLARILARNIVEPINAIDLADPLNSIPYEQLRPFLMRFDENNKELERKMTELERRNQEWNALLSSMDEGLLMFSRKGILNYSNTAGYEIFGLEENFDVKDNEILKRLYSQALHRHSARAQFNQNGRIYSLEASSVIVADKVIGVMILALDVTEKEEAHQRRQEFSANVTHELKTPLQTISSSAELLGSGMVQPEDVPRFAGYITDEAKRMSAMINDIIHLSRLEQESPQIKEKINLDEVCQKVVDNYQQAAQIANVNLSYEGEPVWVMGTIVDLESIVKNLIENAIRYNKPEGSIFVRLKRYDQFAQLKISDTGLGIPNEVQDRIFERFFTADPSRNKTGTGLGLSIVNHAVSNLGGTITVRSKVDVGSTFVVRLPLSDLQEDS
ncbi:MAG: ATP-binding protein [Erysipelotrichaceae bacterium]|nr:ATP-binding protein [Erysipelotrichaceae bacterium]